MNYFYLPAQFVASYNCSSYGAGAYNTGQVCGTSTTAAGGAGGGAAGGSLANTGMQLYAPLVVGSLLIVAAVVLFFRKPRKASM